MTQKITKTVILLFLVITMILIFFFIYSPNTKTHLTSFSGNIHLGTRWSSYVDYEKKFQVDYPDKLLQIKKTDSGLKLFRFINFKHIDLCREQTQETFNDYEINIELLNISLAKLIVKDHPELTGDGAQVFLGNLKKEKIGEYEVYNDVSSLEIYCSTDIFYADIGGNKTIKISKPLSLLAVSFENADKKREFDEYYKQLPLIDPATTKEIISSIKLTEPVK